MKSILYLTLFLVVFIAVSSAQTGSLVGTIAFATEDSRTFIKESRKTSIVLISKIGKTTVVSDENGDYLTELPVGKYCLFLVENEDGTKLKFQPSQHKCFKIYRNKAARFDINLLD